MLDEEATEGEVRCFAHEGGLMLRQSLLCMSMQISAVGKSTFLPGGGSKTCVGTIRICQLTITIWQLNFLKGDNQGICISESLVSPVVTNVPKSASS